METRQSGARRSSGSFRKLDSSSAEAPCEKMAPRSLSSWNTGSHGWDSPDGLDQRGVCHDRACAVALFRRSALRNLAATAKTSPSAIAGQQKRINGSENSEHGRNRILGKIHTGMRVRLGPLRRQVLESDLPPLVALALSCKSRARFRIDPERAPAARRLV
jgi:hypothetical protein